MAWVAVIFTLSSLACSMVGERFAQTAPEFLDTQAMKAAQIQQRLDRQK
jgi:hypothetical protein